MGLHPGFDVPSWSGTLDLDVLQARITPPDEGFESLRQRNTSEVDVCERPALVHSHADILHKNRAARILFRSRKASLPLAPRRLVSSGRIRAVRRPRVLKLCQYSGIQTPKNQKPHPPNTGLNTGIAL